MPRADQRRKIADSWADARRVADTADSAYAACACQIGENRARHCTSVCQIDRAMNQAAALTRGVLRSPAAGPLRAPLPRRSPRRQQSERRTRKHLQGTGRPDAASPGQHTVRPRWQRSSGPTSNVTARRPSSDQLRNRWRGEAKLRRGMWGYAGGGTYRYGFGTAVSPLGIRWKVGCRGIGPGTACDGGSVSGISLRRADRSARRQSPGTGGQAPPAVRWALSDRGGS